MEVKLLYNYHLLGLVVVLRCCVQTVHILSLGFSGLNRLHIVVNMFLYL